MEPLQYLATRASHTDATAFSALPDAPVRPAPATTRGAARWSRTQLAAALHRLADAVALDTRPAPRAEVYGGC